MLAPQIHCRCPYGGKQEGSTQVIAWLLMPPVFATSSGSLCCGSQPFCVCDSGRLGLEQRSPADVNTPTPLGRVSCPSAHAGATLAGASVTWDLACGSQ